MTKDVYVVTCPDLGWDCVVAVYDESVSKEEIRANHPYPDYIIFEHQVQVEVLE